MIIPVPGPTGGLIVVGESVIMYVRKKRSSDDQAVKSIQVSATIVKVSLAGQTPAPVCKQLHLYSEQLPQLLLNNDTYLLQYKVTYCHDQQGTV